jgi:hypothetical protein
MQHPFEVLIIRVTDAQTVFNQVGNDVANDAVFNDKFVAALLNVVAQSRAVSVLACNRAMSPSWQIKKSISMPISCLAVLPVRQRTASWNKSRGPLRRAMPSCNQKNRTACA